MPRVSYESVLYLPISIFAFQSGTEYCDARYFGIKDIVPAIPTILQQVVRVVIVNIGLLITRTTDFNISEKINYYF